MAHLEIEDESLLNEKKAALKILENCHEERTRECMDFYQKTLVKYDEWYDYFQIHKK